MNCTSAEWLVQAVAVWPGSWSYHKTNECLFLTIDKGFQLQVKYVDGLYRTAVFLGPKFLEVLVDVDASLVVSLERVRLYLRALRDTLSASVPVDSCTSLALFREVLDKLRELLGDWIYTEAAGARAGHTNLRGVVAHSRISVSSCAETQSITLVLFARDEEISRVDVTSEKTVLSAVKQLFYRLPSRPGCIDK